MPEEILEICHLSKIFDEGESQRIVFSDLNASILKGEFVVLLGRSGSGKSTLLIPAMEAAKTSPRSVFIRSNVEARQKSLMPPGNGWPFVVSQDYQRIQL